MNHLEFHPIADLFPLMQGSNFDELTEDIREHGLLEPIWLYEDRVLDGRNRWRACQAAGVEPAFRAYEGDDPVGFAVSLNLCRRHLSESQRAMTASKIANLKGRRPLKKSPNLGTFSNGDAAKKLNVSKNSVISAKKVRSQGIPELIKKVEEGVVRVSIAADVADLPKEEQKRLIELNEKAILNAAKKIRSDKAIVRREENERIRQKALSVPPPKGQYRCIVIDPPWPMKKISLDRRPNQVPELDYPTMSLDEIREIEIPAAEQCHLYLWTTQKFIRDAFMMMDGWEFKYLATMVWHKNGGYQPAGLPQFNCEFVIIGRRGGIEFSDMKDFFLCFNASRREHSRKPDFFYDLVRRVSPGPRLDMFSREQRTGFDQFGAEPDAFLQH